MKYIVTLLLLCYSTALTGAEIRLSGTLFAYPQERFGVNVTSAFQLSKDWHDVPVDTDGNFDLTLDLAEPALIFLHFNLNTPGERFRPYNVKFLLRPGEEIDLSIDFTQSTGTAKRPACRYIGSHAAGQRVLNSFLSKPLGHHLDDFRPLIQQEKIVAEEFFSTFMAILREKHLAKLDELLAQDSIDFFFHLVVTDYIEAGIISQTIRQLQPRIPAPSVAPSEDERRLIAALLAAAPSFDDAVFLTERTFASLAILYVQRQASANGQYIHAVDSDTTVKWEGRSYLLRSPLGAALTIADPRLREYFMAYYLHFFYRSMLGMSDKYDTSFAFFRKLFPASRYLATIRQTRTDNRERSANVGRDARADAPPQLTPGRYYENWVPLIIDEAGSLTSLNTKTSQVDLGSGTYYVDVWATWCDPCLRAMQYNFPADSLLDAHGIERLYISVDQSKDHSRWLHTLTELRLGGYHILAGKELESLLQQEFGTGSGALAIPRYFFIQDGEIVLSRATGPQNLDLLSQQINAVITSPIRN